MIAKTKESVTEKKKKVKCDWLDFPESRIRPPNRSLQRFWLGGITLDFIILSPS